MTTVLIVDDQANQRAILAEILVAEARMTVHQAATVEEAVNRIHEFQPAVVLTDLKMPGRGGLALLEEIGRLPMPPEVIVITAFGSIDTAIKATRLGAYDYLTKPVKPEEVLFLTAKAAEKYGLRRMAQQLRGDLAEEASSGIVAHSPAMRAVLDLAERVAASTSTVLIRGETGTGKECIARLVHRRSARALQPLRSVNCAALTETLLDSELFGYEKGAFTGAASRRVGIIEAASGGTLFLDEIGDMSPNTQARVLRVLQEHKIRRVGGTDDIDVDVRVIAATNRNLEEAVKAGSFREDLYYRLNVVPIVIPPLRERREDIPHLVAHFLSRLGRQRHFDPDAMRLLAEYGWPGNVRELEAVVERTAILSRGETVRPSDLPPEIAASGRTVPPSAAFRLPDEGIVFEDWERSLFTDALSKTGGNMTAAAKLLGMSYRAFRYRAKGFGLA